MPLMSGKRTRYTPTRRRRVIIKPVSSSRNITKPQGSAASKAATTRTKPLKSKSIAKPVGRAPVKNTRSNRNSSMSKVTKKSPIGKASVGRTTTKATGNSMSRTVRVGER